MFNLNIDPVLISLGSLQIRYYGLVFVIGFIVALYALKNAVRNKILDIEEEKTYDFIFYLLIGIIIGARMFHVIFWGFDYYFSNPLKILYVWQGGLSFHGGLAGAFVVTTYFSKKFKISFWKLADIISVVGALMLGFGRIANLINQEILGTITNKPWCVKFLRADPDNCRHPVQIYAAIGIFGLFFILLKLKKYKDGFVFWNFVFLTGLGRFFLDFIREDIRYFGLSAGQWLSLIMIIIGFFTLVKYYKEDLKLLFKLGEKKAAGN